MSTRPLDFIKLNLQLDTKQFLLHVLLVQAASPPPVQAASPSPVPGLIMRVRKNEKLKAMEKVRLTRACVRKRSDAATKHL